MRCVACGSEIPAGSRFCPQCGRVVNPSSAPSQPPTAPPPGPPSTPPGPSPPPPPPPSYGPYTSGPAGYPPPPSYGSGTAGPVAHGLASFGQRVGAALIDGVVLWAVARIGGALVDATRPAATFDNPAPNPSGLGGLLLLVVILSGPIYYIWLEGRVDGQTVGKRALGIRVVRKANGAPLGSSLAAGRFLARFVNFLTLGFGLLWAAWDPLHQAFHDKIAGTLVVRSAVYPPPRPGAP